jgi:hypothetical protein
MCYETIKRILSRYSSELAKVLKSEKSGAGLDDIYVLKLFCFEQADLFLRSVCTPRLSSSTNVSKKTITSRLIICCVN